MQKDKCVVMMSAYFCPHSVFNSEYLIKFVCLKSDLTAQQQHRSHICSTRRKLAPSEPRRWRRRSITQQPHCSIAPAKTQILEREGDATCHPVIAQSKWSKLVKYSNLVKDWSNKRG